MKKLGQLGKNFWPLVALKSLNWIPDSFLSMFMTSYIMRAYANPIILVTIYNIFFSIFVFVSFYFACRFFKSASIAWIYRWGLIICIGLLAVIGVTGTDALNFVWIMGTVYGLAIGLIALGLNYMQTSLIKNQIKFSSYRTIFGSLVKVCFPALCGFLLGQYSYPQMAFVILIVCLGIMLISTWIQEPPTPIQCPVFNMRKFWDTARRSKHRGAINLVLLGEFLYGSNLVLTVVQTMLIIYLFKTDLSLGLINSGLTLGLIVFRFFFGRFGSQKYFKPIFMTVLLLLFGCMGTLAWVTEFNFLVFCLCFSLANDLLKLVYEPVTYTLFRVIPSYEKEFLALREFWIDAGRIVLLGGLIFVAMVPNIPVGLTWYGLFLVFVFMMATIVAMLVNRRVRVS